MKKDKQCRKKLAEKRYVVRYFDENWSECEELSSKGSLCDALINVALWCRSRELDKNDESIIIFSVYHNYPFISVEEEGYPYGEETETTDR